METTKQITRRSFIQASSMGTASILLANNLWAKALSATEPFPMIDYHVHITDEFTIEKAVELSEQRNVKFGIVHHPGEYFGMAGDKELKEYIEKLRKYPVFVGLQPIYPGWSKDFSQELVQQLDYILMDGIIVPSLNGGWDYTWQVDYYVENVDEFMQRYMNHVVNILENEPMHIFAWPTFLPMAISRRYNELWTDDRIDTIIDLAKSRNIAIEINEIARVPDERFINRAKMEGLKFTFGTDARNHNAGRLTYCKEMIQKCALTADDIFRI